MLLRTDLFEEDDELVLEIEVPGIDAAKLDVRVGEGVVQLGLGIPEASAPRRYHRRERGGGTFRRELPLPLPVIPRLAEATLRDGLLTVRVPLARAASDETTGALQVLAESAGAG